jgi:hypothetical protein
MSTSTFDERSTSEDSADISIVVREQDIPSAVAAQVAAVQQRRRVLGEDEKTAQEWILEALPAVIAKRVRPMLPEDFELSEMQMKVSLQGKPFGVGVGGEVLVTLRRKSVPGSS